MLNSSKSLLLASSSPRRQYLLKEAGFTFTVAHPDIDESFPEDMPRDEVPSYLARKKAQAMLPSIKDEIIVASDTVVILGNKILNKPLDRAEAIAMLSSLSGNTHTVITAVCLLSKTKEDFFDDRTQVTFRKISKEEIEFYVDNYKPYDKAGAYGAQDCLPAGVNPCSKNEIDFLQQINNVELVQKTFTRTQAGIGLTAIEKINGSYFTVMGLPVHRVYERLQVF